MALGKTTAFQTRAFAIMLVVMTGSATSGPASAQSYWGDRSSGGWGGWGWGGRSSGSWGDRYPSDRYYRRSPHRDFFSPFSGERRNRPAPAVDYSKAPPPRKLETPPSQTVVVIGDSMAERQSRTERTRRPNMAATVCQIGHSDRTNYIRLRNSQNPISPNVRFGSFATDALGVRFARCPQYPESLHLPRLRRTVSS
jgi:hypothetical protein